VGAPHHVTQRGNNRQTVFFRDSDRQVYMAFLIERCRKFELTLLGWCLMPNQIHLVAVPERADSLARALGRAHYDYAAYFNHRKRRSGHVWQNRFYSTPLDRDHLGTALRYVDLNPVRGGLVERAADYRWSSARAHIEGRDPSGMLDLKTWKQICPCRDWEQALAWSNADEQLAERLRQATRTGRPSGPEPFVTDLEQVLQRPLQRRKPGPAKRSAAGA
jgi:putative transposase